MSEYSFPVSGQDLSVALQCEADRAKREGFTHVESRQRKAAVHLDNAVQHMENLCAPGYRVQVRIVVEHVPDVNPVLDERYRRAFKFPVEHPGASASATTVGRKAEAPMADWVRELLAERDEH